MTFVSSAPEFVAVTSSEPGGLTGWLIDLMETLGGPGAALAIALENLFPPLPSELFLPLAGLAASRGDMTLFSALAWTTIGSVVGALALYGVGAAIGRDRIRAVAARLPLVKVTDVDKTERWFAKHGVKAVLFGRMVPVFRSLISVPAGVERMSLWTFVALTAVGSLVWNTALVMAGYGLGENWHLVESYVGVLEKAVLGTVVVAVGYFVVTRLAARRRVGRVDG